MVVISLVSSHRIGTRYPSLPRYTQRSPTFSCGASTAGPDVPPGPVAAHPASRVSTPAPIESFKAFIDIPRQSTPLDRLVSGGASTRRGEDGGPRIEHRYHVIATMVLQLLARGQMLGGAVASILALMRLLWRHSD